MEYKVYQSNAKNATKGLWYAKAVHKKTYTLPELCEHMANHNTPFSKGQIYAILGDMTKCINKLTEEGFQVSLDGLATFRVAFRSRGCADLGACALDTSLVAARHTVTPSRVDMNSRKLLSKMKFTEFRSYNVIKKADVTRPGVPGQG